MIRALLALLRAPIAITSITPVCLDPGDVIVITVDGKLSGERVHHLRQMMARVWPGQKSLILDGDMSLQVIRTPQPPEKPTPPENRIVTEGSGATERDRGILARMDGAGYQPTGTSQPGTPPRGGTAVRNAKTTHEVH
jgi:hypothetical protein